MTYTPSPNYGATYTPRPPGNTGFGGVGASQGVSGNIGAQFGISNQPGPSWNPGIMSSLGYQDFVNGPLGILKGFNLYGPGASGGGFGSVDAVSQMFPGGVGGQLPIVQQYNNQQSQGTATPGTTGQATQPLSTGTNGGFNPPYNPTQWPWGPSTTGQQTPTATTPAASTSTSPGYAPMSGSTYADQIWNQMQQYAQMAGGPGGGTGQYASSTNTSGYY